MVQCGLKLLNCLLGVLFPLRLIGFLGLKCVLVFFLSLRKIIGKFLFRNGPIASKQGGLTRRLGGKNGGPVGKLEAMRLVEVKLVFRNVCGQPLQVIPFGNLGKNSPDLVHPGVNAIITFEDGIYFIRRQDDGARDLFLYK